MPYFSFNFFKFPGLISGECKMFKTEKAHPQTKLLHSFSAVKCNMPIQYVSVCLRLVFFKICILIEKKCLYNLNQGTFITSITCVMDSWKIDIAVSKIHLYI